MDKPLIDYPCRWQYTVVGENEGALRQILLLACTSTEVDIRVSHHSSGGKYVSLKAEALVASEEERDTIFRNIQSNHEVRFVL
ncbi:MAG: DUF493 domain-containing protein [Desulfobulbaceae bacterium]|jgi:putative lipoic acid-binding regulatory protein|nr:DUF493 domain-containing protein [Desulfobulbaceae bacterium]